MSHRSRTPAAIAVDDRRGGARLEARSARTTLFRELPSAGQAARQRPRRAERVHIVPVRRSTTAGRRLGPGSCLPTCRQVRKHVDARRGVDRDERLRRQARRTHGRWRLPGAVRSCGSFGETCFATARLVVGSGLDRMVRLTDRHPFHDAAGDAGHGHLAREARRSPLGDCSRRTRKCSVWLSTRGAEFGHQLRPSAAVASDAGVLRYRAPRSTRPPFRQRGDQPPLAARCQPAILPWMSEECDVDRRHRAGRRADRRTGGLARGGAVAFTAACGLGCAVPLWEPSTRRTCGDNPPVPGVASVAIRATPQP